MHMSDSSPRKGWGGGQLQLPLRIPAKIYTIFYFFIVFFRGNLKFAKSIANPAKIVKYYYLGNEARMSHTVFDKCQPLK